MTISLGCIAVAFLLIWVPRVAAAIGQGKRPEGYDNKHPRDQQAKLEGWARRAHAAHQNTLEAFAPFAAGVLVAHVGHGRQSWADALALTFVGARALYPILYMANVDKARSAIWTVGVTATSALLLLPLVARD